MSDSRSRRALRDLLASCFRDDEEVRRYLSFQPDLEVVVGALPGVIASKDHLISEAVERLFHRGLIDDRFFNHLENEFPARAIEINEVRGRWNESSSRWASTDQKVFPTPLFPEHSGRILLDDLRREITTRNKLASVELSVSEANKRIAQIKRKLREGPRAAKEYRLGGRFWLLEEVGAGGFATVWKAIDLEHDQVVAVKILHARYSRDRHRIDRFARGAKNMAVLDHLNIVKIVKGYNEENGIHYFAMKFIEGRTLEESVLERRISQQEALHVITQVGEALAYAHGHFRRMIHRDVKPSNILVDEAKNALLTDFDLVWVEDSTGGTRSGVGTFVYTAPEIQSSPGDVDQRVDVYSLGMTAIFALHGSKLPFEAVKDAGAFIDALDVDRPIRQSLRRAVEWDREKRYPDMSAFIHALDVAQCATLRRAPRGRALLFIAATGLGLIAVKYSASGPSLTPPSKSSVAIADGADVSTASALTTLTMWATTLATDPSASDSDSDTDAKIVIEPSTSDAISTHGSEVPPSERQPRQPRPCETRGCAEHVAKANSARVRGDFGKLSKLVKRRTCWCNQRLRVQLEVRALKELSLYSQCARHGASDDPEVRRIAHFCQQKRDRELLPTPQ